MSKSLSSRRGKSIVSNHSNHRDDDDHDDEILNGDYESKNVH
jgi:hypothetical protein